ncbi:Peptide deformylase [Fervidicola ferrireducens]|jgi:peptide deformylase|uniref:Peptide deformylase n=2 Tax=Thermosediminibacteraceae TaxID=2770093 RepID=A0A140L4T2_9FIRM|nr:MULTISPECIES: peptide deformylase [Thermosediminibacteraceae]KXG75557.1 Peptide deformylase [Fervidicola ferrireducens]SHM08389.1 peptide deformylase [Caldanaerovirga acetigignens]
MAIRKIRQLGDEVLRKKSKKVTVFDEKLKELIEDMAETMKWANGVGLAAPQVGILKRVVVIDVGEGLIELVNPEIIAEEGEVVGVEGCLSIPGITGEVARPKKVKVRAQNSKGEFIELEGEDLLARALCHEIDHLDGILFIDRAQRIIEEDSEEG